MQDNVIKKSLVKSIFLPVLKTPVKSRFGGFKTNITHGSVLRILVNILTKAFCPPMCFLFVCSEGCFSIFGRIDWVGWRFVGGEDGRSLPTRDPPFVLPNDCDI